MRSDRGGRDTFLFSFLPRAGIRKSELVEFLLFRAKSKTCKGKSLANKIPHVPGTRGTGLGWREAGGRAPAFPRQFFEVHGAFRLPEVKGSPSCPRKQGSRGIPLLSYSAATPKASPRIPPSSQPKEHRGRAELSSLLFLRLPTRRQLHSELHLRSLLLRTR